LKKLVEVFKISLKELDLCGLLNGKVC